MTEPEHGQISYSVKELLARQDAKLDTILLQMSAKADKEIVDRLDGRLSTLERVEAEQKGGQSYLRFVLPWIVSVVALGVAVYSAVQP